MNAPIVARNQYSLWAPQPDHRDWAQTVAAQISSGLWTSSVNAPLDGVKKCSTIFSFWALTLFQGGWLLAQDKLCDWAGRYADAFQAIVLMPSHLHRTIFELQISNEIQAGYLSVTISVSKLGSCINQSSLVEGLCNVWSQVAAKKNICDEHRFNWYFQIKTLQVRRCFRFQWYKMSLPWRFKTTNGRKSSY